MKHLKILGLALVAALAVMALAGAASASAKSILCSTNTNPCTGTKYGTGTKLTSNLKSGTVATLTTSIGNVVCKKSTVSGVTTNGEGTGEITGLTFTECSLGSTSCTVSAVNLKYSATAITGTGGNGTLTVTPGSGIGNPGASVVCGSFINCTFSSSDISLGVTGGNPAIISANGVVLNRSGGICPSTSTWDAEYEVTSPKPLFLEAS
jgi:hypothetical protein